MKKGIGALTLGLDIGPDSIGWALVKVAKDKPIELKK